MPRRRRYRHWSAEEKRSICQQTRAPGVSVAQVARRHGLNANLIFKWLKDPRFAPIAAVEGEPVFLPAEVRGDDAPTVPMACPADGPPQGPVTAKLCILAIWAGIAAKSLEAGVLACRNDYRWKALAGLIS